MTKPSIEIAREIVEGWCDRIGLLKTQHIVDVFIAELSEALDSMKPKPCDEILADETCQWCGATRTNEGMECPNGHTCGLMIKHQGIPYYVGWMREKDYGMWVNEQPNGGFEFEFLDFKPKDSHKFREVFIVPQHPEAYVKTLTESQPAQVIEMPTPERMEKEHDRIDREGGDTSWTAALEFIKSRIKLAPAKKENEG
jgi:hypothetical protein